MTTMEKAPNAYENAPVPVRVRLAALWAAVMFLYVYVDIFYFYKPGTIDDILVGRVWQFEITQAWLAGCLMLMVVPSLMVALSVTLPARIARWTNVVVGGLFIPVTLFNPIGEPWVFLWIGAAIEVAVLAVILRYAWTWPRQSRA